ncbi:hypothetical protein EYF80_025921 [Scomber scombrus]|uniref:Uncharacterized protein n=1 Tax=Scomber scombrus TaxID=13677 RepID=A0AAV1NA08_SCOSC
MVPPPPPSLPPPPPAAAAAAVAAAAARASSNSRWTRLSMMETARLLSDPPPIHFQLRKNWYSRKGAIGQPACPKIAAFLGTNRGRRLSNSRSSAPSRLLSTFYEMLDVAIVTGWTSPPPCGAQSRRRAPLLLPLRFFSVRPMSAHSQPTQGHALLDGRAEQIR